MGSQGSYKLLEVDLSLSSRGSYKLLEVGFALDTDTIYGIEADASIGL